MYIIQAMLIILIKNLRKGTHVTLLLSLLLQTQINFSVDFHFRGDRANRSPKMMTLRPKVSDSFLYFKAFGFESQYHQIFSWKSFHNADNVYWWFYNRFDRLKRRLTFNFLPRYVYLCLKILIFDSKSGFLSKNWNSSLKIKIFVWK